MRLQKEEVAKTLAMKTNKKQNNEPEEEKESKNPEEFKVGDFVRSTFHDDGIDYEAEILSINENGTALIKYIGYGNQQNVKVEDLISSWGTEARDEQKLLAAEADQENQTGEEEKNNLDEFHNFIVNKSASMRDKLPIPPMVRNLFLICS